MGQGRREGHEAHGTAEVKHGMAGRGQEMGYGWRGRGPSLSPAPTNPGLVPPHVAEGSMASRPRWRQWPRPRLSSSPSGPQARHTHAHSLSGRLSRPLNTRR